MAEIDVQDAPRRTNGASHDKLSSFVTNAVRWVRGTASAGATWVEKNPGASVAIAAGLAFVWYSSRRRCAPRSMGHLTAGVWSDLARLTGQQSTPVWTPAGTDLDVKTAQFYLNQVAGARLREDGILGPKTRAALKSFQSHNGIPATGTLDAETSGALEYLSFAVSNNPKLKAAAVMSPTSIARLGPVTYSPYPMPSAPAAVTYSSYPMPAIPAATAPLSSPYMPPELAAAIQYYQSLAAQPPVIPVRTGIQSFSMSDVRNHYDMPGHFEDWGPGPYGSWG